MSEKITFAYWGIRGAAQVSRLLLAYTGAVWEDVKYTEREQWFDKDKKELGFAFPNLPYLIEGDFKMTESSAINWYIVARSDKRELLGTNMKEQAQIKMLQGVLGDIEKAIAPLFWDKEWEGKLPAALEKVIPKLNYWSDFIGEKNFSMGNLTIVDFALAEFSYYIEKISPETFAKFPFLKRVRESFEALPEIQKYYEQETAMKGPFIPPQMSPLGF